MKIVEVPIGEIKPYENNPRNNAPAIEATTNSIKDFGFLSVVVLDRDNTIICGHTRVLAAEKAGMKNVPCIYAGQLTPEQVKAYRLADNKTAELAEWDFEKLQAELDRIEMDMAAFGFSEEENAWFERQEKEGKQRQEGNDEYNEFIDKFEPKKTTDDCYTPENIYDAVADWVAKEYGVERKNFVRPFYPGGDFEKFKYKNASIVVDNPPFSIMTNIIDFYIKNGISFFLFAPSLTVFHYISKDLTAVCTGESVEYENTARVPTSFLTNLEKDGTKIRTAPDLNKAIAKANKENTKTRDLQKYVFPDCILTAAKANYMSKYGQLLKIKGCDCAPIKQLEAMKELKKEIYGGGAILSERAAAERAAAERENVFALSDKEKQIVASLGEKSE
jgi:hypothetical protein